MRAKCEQCGAVGTVSYSFLQPNEGHAFAGGINEFSVECIACVAACRFAYDVTRIPDPPDDEWEIASYV